MEGLVLLTTYEYPWQAQLVQGMLAEHGIESFLFDTEILQANPGLTHALGGVRLMVDRSQVDKARSLLNDPDLDLDDNDVEPACD